MSDLDPGVRPGSAEEAFALLLQLQESGQPVDFETWVSSYPEFEKELRELNEEWLRIKPGLMQALADPSGPDSPRAGVTTLAPARELSKPRPGSKIGEFLLVRPIAQGGMGQVWEALQRSLGRVVALKLIRSDRIDQRTLALFEKEARAGGRMNDRRIVTVFATGESDGVRWIAEEYVAGERTLAQVLARDRQGPGRHAGDFERWARFFADVAEAMQSVHEVGVIHRDLKPGNILITAEGGPKITDFGLARVVDESSFSGQLSIAGTVHYMSPEQAEGRANDIGPRSDVFCLGTVLYEALARRRPFDGSSTPEVLIQISRRDPPDPRTLASDIPKELAWITLKALEKEPQRRYASMAQLAADLRRFLAHEPIRARPATTMERATKWSRRHPTTSVACCLVAVLALAVWGFSSELIGAGQQTLDSKKQELATQALWRVDNDDIPGAEQRINELLALDPTDPLGFIVLATAHARYARFTDADVALSKAKALDLQPAMLGDSALGKYVRSVYLVTSFDDDARRDAERLLIELVEQGYPHAWYPLYSLRIGLGDRAGAAAALASFKLKLRLENDEMQTLVDALAAELDEKYSESIELLERLAKQAPDRRIELRIQRHLGRNHLNAWNHGQGGVDGLTKAATCLEQALEDYPEDPGAAANLAMVQLLRGLEQDERGECDAALEEAERLANIALSLHPDIVGPAEVLAVTATYRILAQGFDAEDPDQAQLAALEEQVEVLEGIDSTGEEAKIARSHLLCFRGAEAVQRGDLKRATALFQECLELNPLQLPARVLLGCRLYLDREDDFAAAYEQFLAAKAIWDDGRSRTWWEGERLDEVGFAIDVWLFGTADKIELPDAATEARDRALTWLDSQGSMLREDQLNLAEFLAEPVHAQLKDCGRALDILERFELEEHFLSSDPEASGPIFEKIHGACGED